MKNEKQPAGSPEEPAFAAARRNDQDESLWLPRGADQDAPLRPHSVRTAVHKLGRMPRVLITPEAYKRMLLIVELAPKEVGWRGSVANTEEGDFLIDQVFLLKQTVSIVETEISVEGDEELVLELLSSGGPAGVDAVNRLRFWGHSHVRMHTEPSLTDERTMANFAADGLPWAIRGIFNKLGRANFTLFLYDEGLRIDDAPWAVWNPETSSEIHVPSPATGSGRTFPMFGFRSGSPGDAFELLPLELKPSDELRASMTVEYGAKVKEGETFRRTNLRQTQQQRPDEKLVPPVRQPGSDERGFK